MNVISPRGPLRWMLLASGRIFRFWRETVRGKKLVFLDSAASAQKPRAVIDAMRDDDGDAIREHPSRSALDERAHDGRIRVACATRSRRC